MPRMRILLTLAMLALPACAAAQPLQGVDLPPASLPDQIDRAEWAVAFSHEFGPGFWSEGPHVYQLAFECPAIGEEEVRGELIAFAAGTDFPTLDQRVHLRLQGLSTTILGPPNVQFVSTEQDTAALLTVVGLSDSEVAAAGECVGEVQWDDGRSAPLRPKEPFRP